MRSAKLNTDDFEIHFLLPLRDRTYVRKAILGTDVKSLQSQLADTDERVLFRITELRKDFQDH